MKDTGLNKNMKDKKRFQIRKNSLQSIYLLMMLTPVVLVLGVLSLGNSWPVEPLASQDVVSTSALANTTNLGSVDPVQESKRTVALLDLTKKNGESATSTQALAHALDVAGIPYITTQSVSTAINYGYIYSSSYISSRTLVTSDKLKLKTFVKNGGILVATGVTDSTLMSLLGVKSVTTSTTRHRLGWMTNTNDPSLRYFDDPNEQVISLGDLTTAIVISTKGYTLGTATSLAQFEDGKNGATVNSYGSGDAYLLGFSYTDLITRNQLDLDYKAERTYVGGFEPTSDTIFLFLRAVYESGQEFAVWNHTSPGDSKATVIITHDVDSTSGMLMMGGFASMEAEHDAIATYNITTHYNKDMFAGDFYSAYIPQMQDLLNRGQKIGSHSVGHFIDFYQETVFPEGAPGNTRTNYIPYYNGTFTTGGTVYGELEVSKDLLESDVGATIKTFRSGHLSYNDKQSNVLDALGYLYDSSFSANDVLTNFPYLFKNDRKLSGSISNVYEIPVTFSDVGLTADNYPAWVDGWVYVTRRNTANFAPSVLLVHPNRDYKIIAQDLYLDQIASSGIALRDMDSYGDFWRERVDLDQRTSITEGVMTIRLMSVGLPDDPGVGLYIDDGASLQDIVVLDSDGIPVSFDLAPMNDSDLVIYNFTN